MSRPASDECTAAWRDAVIVQVDSRGASDHTDRLSVEEPLEIRHGETSLLVTLRTPGADLDLVRGLLLTEGYLDAPEDLTAVAHCQDVPREARGNVVTIALRRGARLRGEALARAGLRSAACGVCGLATLAALAARTERVAEGPVVEPATLHGLPATLARRQEVFAATGGLHAAGLFDAAGRLLASAEDVGRHNAVDKVLGAALRLRKLPLSDLLLLVSGRAGFEIVQKARRAGVPILCAVSAPSSLSLDLARDGGQTLVGFLRDGRFNVYCGAERIGGLAGARDAASSVRLESP